MRLDKYLSDYTELTRSQATKAIRAGRITVNGSVTKRGAQKIVPDTDRITLNGQDIEPQLSHRYLMMHKPTGVVCANHDGEHAIVFDLLGAETSTASKTPLHTVGRLDKDTTGLLLLTDDGQWSHNITSPKRHQTKIYRAQLAEPLILDAELQVQNGIVLKDDPKPTLPATLQRLSDQDVRLTISEGRYHQVKRMFAALGNRVVGLHREAIGSLVLDPLLQPGQYRSLTPTEVQLLVDSN